MGYVCACCGERHDRLPLDLAFPRPTRFLEIPESERAARCRDSDDLCIIDSRTYLIRGVLPVPVRDADEEFVWGMWAEIDARDFAAYRESWISDVSSMPPLHGRLDTEPPGYPGLRFSRVTIVPGAPSERPVFRLRPGNTLLHREQAEGISMERVRAILRLCAPSALEGTPATA